MSKGENTPSHFPTIPSGPLTPGSRSIQNVEHLIQIASNLEFGGRAKSDNLARQLCVRFRYDF
jgi:hypothetical protein